MSVPETSSDSGAPVDPGAYSARRGLPAVVWVLLGVGLVCVLAGLGVARYGPDLFPARLPPPPAAPAPAVFPSVDARLADIQARLAAQDEVQAARDQVTEGAPEVLALNERLDRIERRQQGALDAAATALAVASLTQAAEGSGSFAPQLATVERYLPESADTRALHGLAQGGAPSRTALAAEFPAVAARAAAAAQAGVQGDGLWARVARALASVITIRRLDHASGTGLDATLVRAEARLNDGDVEGALAQLDVLPAAARTAVEDWRRRADRRARIDASLAAVRAQALQQLVQQRDDRAPPANPAPAETAAP